MAQLGHQIVDNRPAGAKGVTLVFIHGSTCDRSFWAAQLEQLSRIARCITVDLPAHGESKDFIPSDELTMQVFVDAVEHLCKTLDLGKVILVGHSMGGGVSLSLYLNHPERVAGLVLIGTGAKLRVSPMILDMVQNDFSELIEVMGTSNFQRSFRKTTPEIVTAAKEVMRTVGPEVALQDFTICNQFDIIEQLGEIHVPALVITGERDTLMPVRFGQFMADRIDGAEFHTIKRAGHFPMVEKPVEVNKIIENFLSTHYQ